MTWAEYYEYLAKLWESVDKTNLQEIRKYNEYRRELRKQMEERGL